MHENSDDFFYSIITFSYTKYFVHSFTVDVVFTLSYANKIGCKIDHLFILSLPIAIKKT